MSKFYVTISHINDELAGQQTTVKATLTYEGGWYDDSEGRRGFLGASDSIHLLDRGFYVGRDSTGVARVVMTRGQPIDE
jgi:hypothetical protein